MVVVCVVVVMGVGVDLILQIVDGVIIWDELYIILMIIGLVWQVCWVVIVNLVIVVIFIVVLVLWDFFGQLLLLLGVVGYEGFIVLVVFNGMWLLINWLWWVVVLVVCQV